MFHRALEKRGRVLAIQSPSRRIPPDDVFADVPEGSVVPDDVFVKAVSLIDYFKGQARRVVGALYGFDEKKRLLEDVSAFVKEHDGGGICRIVQTNFREHRFQAIR